MEKLHYKMYKDGKKWVFAAAVTVIALGVGLSESTYTVKADSSNTVTSKSAISRKNSDSTKTNENTSNSNESTNTANTEDSVSHSNSTTSKGSADSDVSANANEDSTDNSNSVNAHKNSADSRDYVHVTNDSENAAKDNSRTISINNAMKLVRRTPVLNINKITHDFSLLKANSGSHTNISVSYKYLINKMASSKHLLLDGEALTHVTKDNFLDYFSLNGSATYDQKSGIVTITPNENDKVGNFSLKSKIDMNTSFTLTGQINLGSDPNGADGIGFAFHNGNTTDIGNAGGNLGIGGLQDALGFKLDTWTNGYREPQSDKDGSQIAPTDSNGFGWNGDSMSAPYGTFVNTNNKKITSSNGTEVQRWWAEDTGTPQALSKSDIDGQFHDFVVNYDGTTRMLTIAYKETGGNVLTWKTTVSDANQAMAMIVSASTGGAKNLQQFKIDSFDFKQAATVNVKYVDTKGNQIAESTVSYPNGAYVNGTYSTEQLTVPNYTFLKMDDGSATGKTSLPTTGKLTNVGDNGTVIYVYAPAYAATENNVNETINYVDQNGKKVSPSHISGQISFLTVTNPTDGSTITYYSTKTTDSTLDKETGIPTASGWIKANSANFAEVFNPTVDGYKVISNDAPHSDLTKVATQTVNSTSEDLNFTVVYAPSSQPTQPTQSYLTRLQK